MVQIRDEDSLTQEPIAEIPVQSGGFVTNRDDYMSYLREQLIDFLPPHDKKQDDFMNKLPNLLFLPANANDEANKIYDELCVKRTRLIKIQKERTEINTWLWSFYNQEMPHVTVQQCREQVKQLFAGKRKFYDISKEVEEMLYKLHAIAW